MDANKNNSQNMQSQPTCDNVPKNKSQYNNTSSGNYINAVQLPIGVQYHRRKLTPQEYQSRLYYSNTEYVRDRCREDYYAVPSAAASTLSSSSSISSQQTQSQQTQQQQQQQQQQQHQQQQQQTQQCQLQQQQDEQSHSSEESDNNLNKCRVAATQTSSCDQIASTNLAPVLYTPHRVTVSSQIQSTTCSTFAASTSVSSVVSVTRSETDYVAVGGSGENGLSITTNYQQSSSSTELQTSGVANNYNPSSSSTNYSNGAKSTNTTVPRPLQNVIPTCVYLMSRIAVHMEIEGTAQCPTQVMLAAALGCEELGIANKLLAQSIFGLWMTSALLEIQLKSHHRPYVVRVAWPSLLDKYSHGSEIEKKYDEPMVVLKRNVFFSKKDEEKIKDPRILELLYEEAKCNVLAGRYIMESVHSIMLGGIQARIELGPYNSHSHTIAYFRENQSRFLPQHVAKSSKWSWLPVSRKNSAEVKLLDQYKRVPQAANTRKLMRKYLEFCWALPFYGAAFFHGQVEQPVRGLMSLVNHKDISVLVGINERGVFIIDPVECTLLLGLRYEDLSWDFAKPSSSEDAECQTCIFLQFDAVENGITVSKLMQIFSRQAIMMDALIMHFAEQMRKRREDPNGQQNDHQMPDEPNPIQNNGTGVLCNKLARLTLATYDDEGRCIGQMGSLSISY